MMRKMNEMFGNCVGRFPDLRGPDLKPPEHKSRLKGWASLASSFRRG